MHVVSLHWFRRKQRALAQVALAAFCLAWLQVAALPCLMAAAPVAATVALDPATNHAGGPMPAGMVMAPGEHCVYCPPALTGTDAPGATEGLCAFPHDPQVDARAAIAATLLAPPAVVTLFLAGDRVQTAAEMDLTATPPPRAHTPFAVSYCRFLK